MVYDPFDPYLYGGLPKTAEALRGGGAGRRMNVSADGKRRKN